MKEANAGFVLDIGHAIATANFLNIDYWMFIIDFLRLSPLMYHLSDTNTTTPYDDHLNIGDGDLDFMKLKSMLSNEKKISIETNKKSKDNLIDFEKDAVFLKGIFI